MKEIKFRAWIYNTKEMLLVNEIIWEDEKFWRITFKALPGKGYYIERHDDYEIMQYTGLKDKNGKEIYEGDIIDNYVSKWIVTFNKGCFCANKLPELQPDEKTHIALRAVSEYEVIGNIYENPGLL